MDQVELELARMILFRWDGDAQPFPSIHVLAARFGASIPTVREAVQRLIARGLIRTSYRKGPELTALHRVESADCLPLMVRAATDERQRQFAFRQLTRAARWTLMHGALLLVNTEEADRGRFEAELSELLLLLSGRTSSQKAAFQLHFLAWLGASLSGEVGLEWIGNALDRAFPDAMPWLAAAINWEQDYAAWTSVWEKFLERDREGLRHALIAALEPYHERVVVHAASPEPDGFAPWRQSVTEDLFDDDPSIPF